MTKNEQRDAELLALGKEIAQRKKILVDEYKKTHKLPSRGIIDTPELRALRAEEKRRCFEIIDKYKE